MTTPFVVPDYRDPSGAMVTLQVKLPAAELQALDDLAIYLSRKRSAVARALLIEGRRGLNRQLEAGDTTSLFSE
ncbi:hypothetical protein KBZ20_16385 [Vulcanococcus limneticus Candia 3F8]|uniref:hypothetical protein n=1 Tax=Vulcanococcus limneticus TaxID=2170428 RepID=UPI0020CF9BC4|nr:hypothetical protein [Vulcanococcus limneticus]MCP9793327.1 hypothetical protein [Vulcanococcus limneticus MW73D5]MCP9895345.1 hypothetical protein [Vulcanococcus limneticus Candia 3F8]MCP9898741.1 hypothetical protein [Vulcanococcus limneticus Candia 3B3]